MKLHVRRWDISKGQLQLRFVCSQCSLQLRSGNLSDLGLGAGACLATRSRRRHCSRTRLGSNPVFLGGIRGSGEGAILCPFLY